MAFAGVALTRRSTCTILLGGSARRATGTEDVYEAEDVDFAVGVGLVRQREVALQWIDKWLLLHVPASWSPTTTPAS